MSSYRVFTLIVLCCSMSAPALAFPDPQEAALGSSSSRGEGTDKCTSFQFQVSENLFYAFVVKILS